MRQEPKAGKRIVSRGRYALTKTFAFSLSGVVALCGAGILLVFASLPYASYQDAQEAAKTEKRAAMTGYGDHSPPEPVWHPLAQDVGNISVPLLFITGYGLFFVSRKSWKTARAMQPITRANTGHLSANDSLVRASQEPTQAQEGVLLRAATQVSERQEEQLLRASVRGEQA